MFLKDKDSFLTEISQLTLAAEDGLALTKQSFSIPSEVIGGGAGATAGALISYLLQKKLNDKDKEHAHGAKSALIGALLGALPGVAAGHYIGQAGNVPTIKINDHDWNAKELEGINNQHNTADNIYDLLHTKLPLGLSLSASDNKRFDLANIPAATILGIPMAKFTLNHSVLARHLAEKYLGYNPDAASMYGGISKAVGDKVKEIANKGPAVPRYEEIYNNIATRKGIELPGSSAGSKPSTGSRPPTYSKATNDLFDKVQKSAVPPSEMFPPTPARPSKGVPFNADYLDKHHQAKLTAFESGLNSARRWGNLRATVPLGIGLYSAGNAIVNKIVDANRGQKQVIVQQ